MWQGRCRYLIQALCFTLVTNRWQGAWARDYVITGQSSVGGGVLQEWNDRPRWVSTKLRLKSIFLFFLKITSVSVQRVVCYSYQSDSLGYVSRISQIAALRYVSRTNQSVVFALWFERCSNFNEVMGFRREQFVKWNQNEKCWLSCVFNAYFTALYEKCDTTRQIKDMVLPLVTVLPVLWKWWIVVREKMDKGVSF